MKKDSKWPRDKDPSRDDLRKITAYGESPGTGLALDERDDGAVITAMATGPVKPGHLQVQVELNAENLMKLTHELAEWFGHALVHPTEWRDKLFEVVTAVCEKNEARCLDDDIDRRVVINELVNALAAAALPRSR